MTRATVYQGTGRLQDWVPELPNTNRAMHLKACHLKLTGDWERKLAWHPEGLVPTKAKSYVCSATITDPKSKTKLHCEYLHTSPSSNSQAVLRIPPFPLPGGFGRESAGQRRKYSGKEEIFWGDLDPLAWVGLAYLNIMLKALWNVCTQSFSPLRNKVEAGRRIYSTLRARTNKVDPESEDSTRGCWVREQLKSPFLLHDGLDSRAAPLECHLG